MISSSTVAFQVSIPGMTDGGIIPTTYTCDGESMSPPLVWENAPPEVKEYALTFWSVFENRDGTVYRWVLLDIPADTVSLSEGEMEVGNFGSSGHGEGKNYYIPLCGGVSGYHTSTITLYALSEPLQYFVGSTYNPKSTSGDDLVEYFSQNPRLVLASASFNVIYCHTEPCSLPSV